MSSTSGPVPGGSHPLAVLVPRVRARLAEDSAAGLTAASDAEVVELLGQVERLSAQVEELRLGLVEQARHREIAGAAGAASAASWLAGAYRRHPAACGRDVRLARMLATTQLDATRAALATGAINLDQARAIAAAVDALSDQAGPAVRLEAEHHLLDQAATFNAKELAVLGRRVLDVVDPDHADQMLAKSLAAEEARAERSRELTLSPGSLPGGSGVVVRGRLDAETAEMLALALDPLARPRPTDADSPDTRTPAQRRGDALAEVLRRYLASSESPTSHGLPTQLVITVTDKSLLAGTGAATLLHSGAPLSIDAAQRHACDAQLALLHPAEPASADGGTALTAGTRLFTGRLRRLLELRDRGCAFPSCDRPPAWCDAHHIRHWIHGGRTTLDNGVLLCGHHHRLLHTSPWQVRTGDDGCPEFIPPDYIDPRRKPLRNTRLRL